VILSNRKLTTLLMLERFRNVVLKIGCHMSGSKIRYIEEAWIMYEG